jgi:hypothetical protein
MVFKYTGFDVNITNGDAPWLGIKVRMSLKIKTIFTSIYEPPNINMN